MPVPCVLCDVFIWATRVRRLCVRTLLCKSDLQVKSGTHANVVAADVDALMMVYMLYYIKRTYIYM